MLRALTRKLSIILGACALVLSAAACGQVENLPPEKVIEKAAPAMQAANTVHFTMDSSKLQKPAPGLLIHSDRGGPYLATRVQQQLVAHRAIASTSRPGRCLDNAVAESFFHTLKTELVYQHRYRTREEARLAIFEYIAAFYNRTRRHSSNAYRSPDQQEAQYVISST